MSDAKRSSNKRSNAGTPPIARDGPLSTRTTSSTRHPEEHGFPGLADLKEKYFDALVTAAPDRGSR